MKISPKSFDKIEDEILLKKRKKRSNFSTLLSAREIQDIADFIGDSLDLSKKAQKTDADIVFCGVDLWQR